ncbi:IPT/TIG domain-containing protein [Cecembia calidifontis]|jgi:N-acetylneuraminic acid mutarotase|uniref:IPT/TIG domain-containing protein n=1 Tax=Cecembia calidifontis TaxID=1187080 RepID=A0A4Q7P5Q4_9BACT|nr:IPT/TIG domain-containing protein [Cecembia calidifontis]RZS94798.1 IPT/TIG domain-containing protein [Cecembia calidifontis]
MNRSFVGVFLLLTFLVVFFSSCEEEIEVSPSLVTEDILFVSGEKIRVSGRIITTRNINATDHGFYISENEAFSQPIIISLGEREAPGRFIGEAMGLRLGRRYFVKSFVVIGGEQIFGNIIPFETLTPEIFDFSPNNGPVGTIVTINGKNFTSDTEVFFGTSKAQVISIDFDSRMQVRVPPVGSQPDVNIRVVSQSRELVFDNIYRYTTGKFNQLANFPSSIRIQDGVYLQEGNLFYVGLGSDRSQTINQTMWRYQVGSTNWEQISVPAQSIWRGFTSKTYFGGGRTSVAFPEFSRDFFRLQNGTFVKLPDLPFFTVNGLAFEINNQLYVIGSVEPPTFTSASLVYRYNPSSQTWNLLGQAPFAINRNLISFTYQDRQFIINPDNRELVAYNTTSNSWETVGVYPGEIGNGTGIGAVVGQKAYVGLGNRSVQMWELDLNNFEWIRKNDFGGSTTFRNEATYVHDGLIYVLRSAELQIQGVPSEFWVFDPLGF